MAQTIDIANPTRTQAILNEYGLRAKKKFGQNFLTDLNVLHNIVEAAEITAEDYVIEIGPGIGALTEQLARSAKKVLAFEIDSQMVEVLADTLKPYDNVKVIENDVLKVDLAKVISEEFGDNAHVKIVANLPYYITTPILIQLLRSNINWDNIVVMMQREVADRLNAAVGTKSS
ncbi:MAG: rRNA adenine dimethyltransferase family protein, partial [Leuconostoc mesenteroides]